VRTVSAEAFVPAASASFRLGWGVSTVVPGTSAVGAAAKLAPQEPQNRSPSATAIEQLVHDSAVTMSLSSE
jgi:hypothetical protein